MSKAERMEMVNLMKIVGMPIRTMCLSGHRKCRCCAGIRDNGDRVHEYRGKINALRTMVKLPFVHRFDILGRNGVRYLIACALKSGHEFKDDWSMPGKVYAAVLPEDLSGFDEEHQLELEVIKADMLKNHGYYKVEEDGVQTRVISSESGAFLFVPPTKKGGKWEICSGAG